MPGTSTANMETSTTSVLNGTKAGEDKSNDDENLLSHLDKSLDLDKDIEAVLEEEFNLFSG